MQNMVNRKVVLMVLLSIGSFAKSEVLYEIQASELIGRALYDITLSDDDLVAVKPMLSHDAAGDTSILDQCLWSVRVKFSNQQVELSSGNMICVGPNGEVLESAPQGEIEAVGQCVNEQCDSYQITADKSFKMNLTSNLTFQLQPRNERK